MLCFKKPQMEDAIFWPAFEEYIVRDSNGNCAAYSTNDFYKQYEIVEPDEIAYEDSDF